ncbi:metal-sensitive transcriptional regulator [Tessaracoccus sp. OH4464_COT-324]|uniref:metal-sensitive transcriptional regulator n=1 Tax=Tessaracoccus sp. OH4464_COT-324 TaxID=2491059 RepID=UPI000F637C85|nr:metal-sensitive transcriptional regulator [Tessaracoccus sp. OH4464_COT-324]RRD45793.1 metal-sensitive transcriptional regulator [Tessaracoccus sp. OH4464_COT-324]
MAVHGYSDDKASHLRRLKLIEGQARGIARMVEQDEYCIDILTQISAVQAALRAVSLGLLEAHLGHCVAQAIQHGGAEAEEKLAEATAAIRRIAR